MNLDLLNNIPDWQDRLSEKLLEKQATMWNTALHGAGKGLGWGAGLGALHGGASAALSDDPEAGVVKGAIRGALKGGLTGATLGGAGGAGLHSAQTAAPGMAQAAGALGLPGIQSGITSAEQAMINASRALRLDPTSVAQAPSWAPQWLARPTARP
jgi:hypothetical protein